MSKVLVNGDIRACLHRSLALLGRLEQVIARGDKVLVKPNFNSPDPYPGSTDLAFLSAVLEILLEAGARVTVGESSGGIWRPTRKVFQKLRDKCYYNAMLVIEKSENSVSTKMLG